MSWGRTFELLDQYLISSSEFASLLSFDVFLVLNTRTRTSKGWLQPEVQYVYDLIVPAGVTPPVPKPLDAEVEYFEVGSAVFHLGCMKILRSVFQAPPS